MTEIKTYCDHCGKELDDMKDYSDIELSVLNYCKVDLCSKCLNELQDIIDEFIKIEEVYGV